MIINPNDQLQINLLEALTKMVNEAEEAKIEVTEMEEALQDTTDRKDPFYNNEANPYGLKEVELKSIKEGEYFYRKPKAKSFFIRNHYNRKDQWNNYANFSCTNDDTGSEVFLKPTTKVWID